jgi:hypothetical protein
MILPGEIYLPDFLFRQLKPLADTASEWRFGGVADVAEQRRLLVLYRNPLH